MTLVLDGQSVSRGIVIAPVSLLHRDRPEIREQSIAAAEVGAEVARYERALSEAREQLQTLRARIPSDVPADIGSFIDTYLLMLEDAAFSEIPLATIRERHCTAEWALQLQRDELIAVFEAMADPYLQTRKDDIEYMVCRLQDNLHALYRPGGAVTTPADLRGRIVVAEDFTPEDVMLFYHDGVGALVCEAGGAHSHAAILARGLGLPTIVACYGVLDYLLEDETVLIDAAAGIVVAEASEVETAAFEARRERLQRRQAELGRLREAPARSLDGRDIALRANIEMEEDLAATAEAGAEGCGLFRTEMMFIERRAFPDEEEQFNAYRRALRCLDGRTLTIRTLDLGADKALPGLIEGDEHAANPALGLRSIRYSLHRPDVFAEQVRAILRTSALGPVRLMLPMLTGLEEVHQARRLIDEQRRQLAAHGVAFDPDMPIGGMIEVPAAALTAGALARDLDFLSIGTNDLIQYTLAVDRLDESVAYLYNPLHPAVLRLIRLTVEAAQAARIPLSICGEIAGDPRYTRLLLALGLRDFSMSPASLLEVKDVIRHSHIDRLEAQIPQFDALGTASEVTAFVAVLNACN